MYPVYYKVSVWDEVEEDGTNLDETGFVFAESYSDACCQIEAYYGDTLLSMYVEMCEEGPLVVDEEICKQILMGWNR